MNRFTELQPTLENYWRSIILFGRNVASYKFALGGALLELAEKRSEWVRLEDLAEPFARRICEHLQRADKQGTFRSSRFLDDCRKFNRAEIERDELLDAAVRRGFNSVIDAFHVVHDGEMGVRFFHDDRTAKQKGIRLSDELFRLSEQYQFRNLPLEIEARWRLVETAWELNVPRYSLTVAYDSENELLIVNDRRFERRAVTGCRDALNGYQKGRCFYCFGEVSVVNASEEPAYVDHFFPHGLKPHGVGDLIDGIWNLVLACRDCNRGAKGKVMQVPELRFLERLENRNNFFVDSHHPLSETVLLQTGLSEPERRDFLQEMYNRSKELLIRNWKPAFEHAPAF